MAYYAALVSVIQLLKEINHPQHPYPNSLLPKKHQIYELLYEKFYLVQELLENYSPKDESADILEGQMKDAAYRALNIIESQFSKHFLRRDRNDEEESANFLKRRINAAESRTRDIIRTHISNHFLPRKRNYESASFLRREIEAAADRTQDIIGTHISNQELEKVEEEVDSILEQLMRIRMEKVSIHGDNLQGTNVSSSSSGASTQAQRIDGVGGALKVQDRSGRSTTVALDEDLITTIKDQLCGEPSSRAVISLVGMGGLGKTTLARNIFDDKLTHDHFDCRVWVTVSQDYHQQNILLAIVDSLNMERKEELKKAEVGALREQIYKHLKGRRYIIVMDDVWETKVWDDAKRIFPNDDNGSRVIATTRLLSVALYADNSRFIHELQFLNEDQSWNLFRHKVFCPTELENIGRLIAKNCRGLPLAIVVVAGLLSKVRKTRNDWEEIARDVGSIGIGQNDEHFSKILSLSYNHLPHHLKPCFLYIGAFPEDHYICVSELIWLWIAEGLLKPVASKSLEEVGEEYLKDLVNRNLVLITEKKSYGKIKKCGMHDLLRELCLQKACSERFFHCLHKMDYNQEPVGDVHRFFLHKLRGSLSHTFKKKYMSHVRSILFFIEEYYGLNFFSTHVSGFNLLRVLDARISFVFESDITEVVGSPLHLRYLALRPTRITLYPSIVKLRNLQTLILGPGSSLPSEIWEIQQLRHVKGRSLKFPPIPYDEIRIIDGVPLLGNLQTVQTIQDFIFTRDTVKMIPNLKKLKVQCRNGDSKTWEKFQLNNLVHLRQLEVLSIFGYYYLHDNSLPENFAFPTTLIKLTLERSCLPWKDMRAVGSLPKLQVLKLDIFAFIGEEWEPAEGEFLKLRFLLMSNLWYFKYWQAKDIHFPCLEKLHIIACGNLLEIPVEIGDIPTLQCMVVEKCNSYLESSALKIQEEQEELGNYDLQVRVIRGEDSNSTNASEDCNEDGNYTNENGYSEDGNSTNASDDCSEDGNYTNEDDRSEDGNSTNDDGYG